MYFEKLKNILPLGSKGITSLADIISMLRLSCLKNSYFIKNNLREDEKDMKSRGRVSEDEQERTSNRGREREYE